MAEGGLGAAARALAACSSGSNAPMVVAGMIAHDPMMRPACRVAQPPSYPHNTRTRRQRLSVPHLALPVDPVAHPAATSQQPSGKKETERTVRPSSRRRIWRDSHDENQLRGRGPATTEERRTTRCAKGLPRAGTPMQVCFSAAQPLPIRCLTVPYGNTLSGRRSRPAAAAEVRQAHAAHQSGSMRIQ